MKTLLNLMLAVAFILIFGTVLALGRISPDAEEKSELRFGATLPLTGPAASYGKLIQDGIELARKDLSAAGVKIKIVYEDVPGPGLQAVTALRRLISIGHIEALVGNFYNPNVPAMAPVIAGSKLPTFHTAAADDHILSAGEYVFTTNTAIKDEARALADYAYDQLRARKAAVLNVGTTFGEAYRIHFTARFLERGGEIVFQDWTTLEETDLRSPLLRARVRHPDIYVFGYFGRPLGLAIKAAAELQLKEIILSTYETEDPAVLETAGDDIGEAQVQFFVPEPAEHEEEASSFRKKFKEQFGYPPRILAANAYDATVLAANAFTKCKRDKACARQVIAATKAYDGASGTFSIDQTRSARKAFVLKGIRRAPSVDGQNRLECYVLRAQ